MAKSIIIITTVGKHGKIFDNIEYIIRNNTNADFSIALAYNGPKDNHGFFSKISGRFPSVDIVKSGVMGNIPVAIGNVIRKHKADYFFILDDDLIIFEKDWIRKAIAILDGHMKIGVLGLAEDKYIDRDKQRLGYLDKGSRIKICDWAPTIMCAKKEVIDKIKFDRRFPLGHYDIDWQTCVREKGYIIANCRIKYVHIGGLSTTWMFLNREKSVNEWINEKRRISLYLSKHRKLFSGEYIEKELGKLEKPPGRKFFMAKWILNQVKGIIVSWAKINYYNYKYR